MAEKSIGKSIWETVKTVVSALVIAGLFRTLLFQPFYIPSGSMKDTLLIGDFLFVNKMAYGYSYASCPSVRIPAVGIDLGAEKLCGFMDGENTRVFGSEPERGDVIVFRHPKTGQDYIKRLIGLPGDTVQLVDGKVVLNGKELPQEPAGTFTEVMEPQGPQGLWPRCQEATVGRGGVCSAERYIETLPEGKQHAILDIGMQPQDNTGVFTVPAGHYFFMGDNRDNSLDSRFMGGDGVGFVPFENLIGRADRVIFSSGGSSLLAFWQWRSDRFFKALD